MVLVIRGRKLRLLLFGAVISVAVLVLTKSYSPSVYQRIDPFNSDPKDATDPNNAKVDGKPIVVGTVDKKASHKFWELVFTNIARNQIKVDDPNEAIRYLPREKHMEGLSKEALLSKAEILPETIKEFKTKHTNYVNSLPEKLDASLYVPGTTGIVMVGGGRFSWLSYLSLVSLRGAGSNLPVEIVMPTLMDFENERDFCASTLPALNAKCVVLPDSLGATVMTRYKFHNYQFKTLAVLVSSFQNVLLLDSDNVMVQSPDAFMNSKMFHENGLITWPDYWQRTISPTFYDIAGIKVNERKRVRYNRFPLQVESDKDNLSEEEAKTANFHELEGSIPNLSTESGQLAVNKVTHGRTLLLSLYYNVYGPKLYYKMLSLGEQGEGDKDTFLAAAVRLGEPFYQIKSYIRTWGYADVDGKFQGVAMAQKDPMKDFELHHEKIVKPLSKGELSGKLIDDQISYLKDIGKEVFGEHSQSPIWTVHCNYPKLDPLDYILKPSIYDAKENRLKYRLYGTLKYTALNRAGQEVEVDFELEQWKNMEKIICKNKISFIHLSKFKGNLCEFVKNQVEWLSKNPIMSN
ncbi:uncharacterized protein KQ657_002895 [Scheffersomyces spartinae]|uniref:Alpha-1,2-mannosyltransferase n=1 Tax=Scheffersomyces spartinae TaxID=45513 RepID=A0A9P7V5P2_9ASCO|nr:uncharacterized protein KQ657_002895 [Scheffersomyces spartinae]KAG7191626.1 hypothetical protein KQ657_002895 [Scheffersomyces spartinae]